MGTVQQRSVAGSETSDVMMTRWGKEVTAENAWREYPRPQLERASWQNLNGLWQVQITSRATAEVTWDDVSRNILVPYPVESALSGVGHSLEPDEALWYRRTFQIGNPDSDGFAEGMRLKLNFEAVDYRCRVWVNQHLVGEHVGGSNPFQCDITDAIDPQPNAEQTVVVRVEDPTRGMIAQGKQRLQPKGIFYTRVSGIWQTVWLEAVPQRHVAMVKMKPRIGPRTLRVLPTLSGDRIDGESFRLKVFDGIKPNAKLIAEGGADLSVTIPEEHYQTWSPTTPQLYGIELTLLDGQGKPVDTIRSYAGMREVGVKRDEDGHLRFTLNNEIIFHLGTLDQGWWPDGLWTPPSDKAMQFDVQFLKDAGFNVIRKHIKREPRRYYLHCDQIGMMVWQDMVSAQNHAKWTRMQPNPTDAEWPDDRHQQFVSEIKQTIADLRNHPCVVVWVPFNEAWGQHRTMDVGRIVSKMDPTRPMNIASGGNFFPIGDVADHHSYPDPSFPLKDSRFVDYVKVVGEFGGHGYAVPDHVWGSDKKPWGYGDLSQKQENYRQRYANTAARLKQLKSEGIAAGIYTQTSDVETEVNGLLTYDRESPKIPAADLRSWNQALLP